MARYKHIDTSPRFLAVDLKRQLLPGTFEHALDHLLDHCVDLSRLDVRSRNDATGATACLPAMLLKVVLFAYSQGIVSSRGMERACRELVALIARCGDTAPHFTTLAGFVHAAWCSWIQTSSGGAGPQTTWREVVLPHRMRANPIGTRGAALGSDPR